MMAAFVEKYLVAGKTVVQLQDMAWILCPGRAIKYVYPNLKHVHVHCYSETAHGNFVIGSVSLCVAKDFENLMKLLNPLLEKCKRVMQPNLHYSLSLYSD